MAGVSGTAVKVPARQKERKVRGLNPRRVLGRLEPCRAQLWTDMEARYKMSKEQGPPVWQAVCPEGRGFPRGSPLHSVLA